MTESVKNVIRGPSGRTSSSRSFMWFFAGFILAIWFIVVAGIFLAQTGLLDSGIEWAAFEGAMSWARDFVFVSVLPYATNKLAAAIESRKVKE